MEPRRGRHPDHGGLTARRALFENGGLRPGQTMFALQFAKLVGARVIATSSSDEKLERLRALGADALINDRSEPEWGMRVRALTDGRGSDHVVDVCEPDTLAQSILATRVGGHIALIGVLSGLDGQLPLCLAFGRRPPAAGRGCRRWWSAAAATSRT